eukprot:TRINITY_DN27467_c0_g1_i1.p1 TRINITY_DN27467_c0_g1~~TRINITY_DN27467_c0_g1_i1.p1  ORF type:complete len:127 (+),score=7.29 TRINITY_DN27467_c0_g1_i1:83-463(+)
MIKQLLAQSRRTMLLAIVASALSAVAGVMIIGGVNHALEHGFESLTNTVIAYVVMVAYFVYEWRLVSIVISRIGSPYGVPVTLATCEADSEYLIRASGAAWTGPLSNNRSNTRCHHGASRPSRRDD